VVQETRADSKNPTLQLFQHHPQSWVVRFRLWLDLGYSHRFLVIYSYIVSQRVPYMIPWLSPLHQVPKLHPFPGRPLDPWLVTCICATAKAAFLVYSCTWQREPSHNMGSKFGVNLSHDPNMYVYVFILLDSMYIYKHNYIVIYMYIYIYMCICVYVHVYWFVGTFFELSPVICAQLPIGSAWTTIRTIASEKEMMGSRSHLPLNSHITILEKPPIFNW